MEHQRHLAVVMHLVRTMEAQLEGMRQEFGSRIDAVEQPPTMVVMRTPEMEALKHCLTLMGRASLFDRMHDFAARHVDSDRVAAAGVSLIHFFVGKCDHAFVDESNHCELCGPRER